jgi:hypothetical protein
VNTDPGVTATRPPTARDKAPRGLACGYFVSPYGSRKACDLAGPCVAPVIHFSTATFVHSCRAVDQRVYVNYPQAYPQDATLTRPRASVIGASSHAGPGFPCAHSGQRRPGLNCTLIMPRTARRPRLRSQPLPHRRPEPGAGTPDHGRPPRTHRPQAGTAIRWPRATPQRIPSRGRRNTGVPATGMCRQRLRRPAPRRPAAPAGSTLRSPPGSQGSAVQKQAEISKCRRR